MKKQIFILTMLTLALFFSATSLSFGQLNSTEEGYLSGAAVCPAAVDLSCATGTGLNPVPGQSYAYTITVTPDFGSVHFYVTDEADVLNPIVVDPGDGTGNYLLTSDAAYDDAANTTLTVNLSWKYFDGAANNVVLVAYVTNAAGCTDNIDVWRIIPNYSFTLDLAGVLDDGTAGNTECPGSIVSASYTGTQLNVVYGDNYVFFAVTAANWQTSWEPTFSAGTNLGTSGITSVEWAYADEADDPLTTWNASGTPVLASHYGVTGGFVDEACIIVRVLVDHSTAENLTAETITLSINGDMWNPDTNTYDDSYPDLDEAGAGNPCLDDVTDTEDYIISPRPDIDATAPGAFETKSPTEG